MDRRKKKDIEKKKQHQMPRALHFYGVAFNPAERFDGEVTQRLNHSHSWETPQLPKTPSGDWSSTHRLFFSQRCDCLSLKGVPVTRETHISWSVLIQT